MIHVPVTDLEHQLLNTPSREAWKRIGTHRRAGLLVPLFSVYSRNSVGVGDFRDLRLLIDWCLKSGNSILQLLPINELGSLLCPYDSLSSFALEPLYVTLDEVECINTELRDTRIEKLKKRFPAGNIHVDYGIRKEKLLVLKDIFTRDVSNDPLADEMQGFIHECSYWIHDFALFKALRAYHQERPWYEWEEDYRYRDKVALANFREEHQKEIMFHIWVQWILYKQLRKARVHTQEQGIFIKGDLPLLVSRDSADVWAHPEFFKLDFAAGAPPDMYCAKGQRWGMPTYNWEQIGADGYIYLREKLRYAENFYDLLRIDHVVGLFRIWSIPYKEPLENQGLNGAFDPKDELAWEEHGKKILSVMLHDTKMLLCAEDLGVIPAACPKTLKEFGIPGNDVQRWVKDWGVRHDFLPPSEYRLLSVAMLSTHDTTTWAAWWENEAGTVDEALFKRKCSHRNIDYTLVKDRLFDGALSRHGRLRWLKNVSTAEILTRILEKKKEEIQDFIEMYLNTYQEKEKLWKLLGMPGLMQEKARPPLISAALKLVLESRAIFSIQLMTDWLSLVNLFRGDPYEQRINTPGTIGPKNWSLNMSLSLDELLRHKLSADMRSMITASARK